jgi:glycine/D-amino acid oxidase-like deaminating enzyme
VLRHETVVDIQHNKRGFCIGSTNGLRFADKIVLAAGLGNTQLAKTIGLEVPVRPQRGQILVTERLKPFLNYPTSLVRQTVHGSVMLGDSHEEAGFDDGTSIETMAGIADRAHRIYPQLGNARIVRAWGALRILTPDGLPIYAQSNKYPGAFAATSHSGVTLAAVHAMDIAHYIEQGKLPETLSALSEKRFLAAFALQRNKLR